MPIVYVHGVANRLNDHDQLPGWDEISTYLRRYVAPEISQNPDQVPIKLAFWGDKGANFRWQGISRPRTKLLAQGAGGSASPKEQLNDLGGMDELPAVASNSVPQSALSTGQNRAAQAAPRIRLKDLAPDELSGFLCAAIEKVEDADSIQDGKMTADQVAHDDSVRRRLAAAPDLETELRILREELERRSSGGAVLAPQGPTQWWNTVVERAREVATRVDSIPAFALSRLVMETRGPINEAVTTFLGDVFEYAAQKQDRPGAIRGAVLDVFSTAKQEASDKNEPLIVLSHSMGGQIVIDLATHFLSPELRIDFWAAAASQVGFFEEMKLLLASDPAIRGPLGRASFPPNVGWWWNVWDSNDALSFTARSIFDLQVDDEEWNSGASLAAAHGAYLRRPSFYRRLAHKIQVAQEQDFNRP